MGRTLPFRQGIVTTSVVTARTGIYTWTHQLNPTSGY